MPTPQEFIFFSVPNSTENHNIILITGKKCRDAINRVSTEHNYASLQVNLYTGGIWS
ncbi:MAG: hypothetical protein KME64_10095 [Scytonematopsis contorta HA4267-MV1]|jgi:hypothetical protein|nr:hypothetical protein [Scytonematopsis contorta HA4267-MV1]